MTTTDKITRILDYCRQTVALGDAATLGPWVQNDHPAPHNQLFVRLGNGSANAIVERRNVFEKVSKGDVANAAFIAHSRLAAVAHAQGMIVAIEGLMAVAFVNRSEWTRDQSYNGDNAFKALEALTNLPQYAHLYE